MVRGNFILGNVGRGVLVPHWPWPIFQNYNGPLLASHDGASMAAGTGPSKVLCIMLIGWLPVFELEHVHRDVNVVRLRLLQDLIDEQHVRTRRVDKLRLDLGSDDAFQTVQHLGYLVHGVRVVSGKSSKVQTTASDQTRVNYTKSVVTARGSVGVQTPAPIWAPLQYSMSPLNESIQCYFMSK